MSIEEYNQIKPGMTTEEVRKIVGGSGEEVSRRSISEGLQEYKYRFSGEKKGSATLTYEVRIVGFTPYWSLVEKEEDNLK